MKLTPQDILNQIFSSKRRGFDPHEVKEFLTLAAEVLENEIKEKEELKAKTSKMGEGFSRLEKREEVLRDTLIAAQKFSSEVKANAQKEAELILRDAEMKADEIISAAMKRQKSIKDEIVNLKLKRKDIENEILHLLSSLKELIETYTREDEQFDKVEYLSK